MVLRPWRLLALLVLALLVGWLLLSQLDQDTIPGLARPTPTLAGADVPDPDEVEPLPRIGPDYVPPAETPAEVGSRPERYQPIGFQLPGQDCSQTLQTRITNAAAGSVLYVPGCLYREQVTINKALTLSGIYGAEIRGSDVWTSFTGTGPYTSTQTVPSFSNPAGNAGCLSAYAARCNAFEQVFVDGTAQIQVASGPGAGQFSLDASRHVVLGSNPSGHTVEVTTRQYWVRVDSDNVTIQNFVMKHAATGTQRGALSNRYDGCGGYCVYNNFTIQNSYLSDAHGSIISLSGSDNAGVSVATGLRAIGNDIHHAGGLGIHGTNTTGALVRGNLIHQNTTEGYDPGWEAGSVKMTVTGGLVLDGNEVYGGTSPLPETPGLWCDISCGTAARAGATAIEIKRNRVHDNGQPGIFFEISAGALIHHNVVWNNGGGFALTGSPPGNYGYGAGILISSSNAALVYNNTLAWNADGVVFMSQDRGGFNLPNQENGNVQSANVIIMAQKATDTNHRHAFMMEQDWGSQMFGSTLVPSGCSGINNCGHDNQYWIGNSSGVAVAEGDAWYSCNSEFSTLASMNATNCEQNSTYLSDAAKTAALSAARIPAVP